MQGPPGLALSGQVQPERVHLRLERARAELLGHRRVPLRGDGSFTLIHRIRPINRARKVPFTGIGMRDRMRFGGHVNPSPPAVSAGKRAARAASDWWSGTGSNCRPSAFQLASGHLTAQVSRRACAPDRRAPPAARRPAAVGHPNGQPFIQLPLRQAENDKSRRMEHASMDQTDQTTHNAESVVKGCQVQGSRTARISAILVRRAYPAVR
jgi:hypothetical protein